MRSELHNDHPNFCVVSVARFALFFLFFCFSMFPVFVVLVCFLFLLGVSVHVFVGTKQFSNKNK